MPHGMLARTAWLSPLCVLLLAGCSGKPPYEGKSVGQLTDMLRSTDPARQMQGAYGLSRLGPKASSAIPQLVELLRSGNALVRQNAAMALGKIGPEAREAVRPLTGLLADRDWTVRRNAVLALGEMGPAASAAATDLQRTLQNDPQGTVRTAAAEALARIIPSAPRP